MPSPAAAGGATEQNAAMPHDLKIDFVSDVSCPWCAIGLASWETALVRLEGDVAAQVRFEPFELRWGEPAIWPGGIAVVEPLSTPVQLLRLHSALAERLGQLELPLETRPYRPHVTLARRAQGAQPPAEGPEVRWHVRDGYVLVRSAGGEYEVIERY